MYFIYYMQVQADLPLDSFKGFQLHVCSSARRASSWAARASPVSCSVSSLPHSPQFSRPKP